jgi:hypothetical protein
VWFNCKGLANYDHAHEQAQEDGIDMDQVCKDTVLSGSYGLGAEDYTTDNDHSDNNRVSPITRSKDYDIHSVMHYDSTFNGKGDSWPDVPLMKWKSTYNDINNIPIQGTLQNAEYIESVYVPSQQDIQAIKELYPQP